MLLAPHQQVDCRLFCHPSLDPHDVIRGQSFSLARFYHPSCRHFIRLFIDLLSLSFRIVSFSLRHICPFQCSISYLTSWIPILFLTSMMFASILCLYRSALNIMSMHPLQIRTSLSSTLKAVLYTIIFVWYLPQIGYNPIPF